MKNNDNANSNSNATDNNNNTTSEVITTLENLSDTDLLKYLISEGVKTKREIVMEIQERFYAIQDFQTYLEKSKSMWDQ